MKHKYNSFLVINIFGIGDVLFTTPILRNLRNAFPEAKIFFLCNRKTAPILKSHPLISKIFVYERDEFVAAEQKSFWAGFKKYHNLISEIKKEKIDCAIVLPLHTLFGFFAWAAGIKHRCGLDYKNRGRFLTHKVKIEGFLDKHVVEYYLDTLTLLDVPIKTRDLEVGIHKESQQWADNLLKQYNLTNSFIIGVAPFGGDTFGKDDHVRRWPPGNFAALIDRLSEELKAKIFIFAGPKEKEDVSGMMNIIRNKNNCYEFAEVSLEKMVSLIDKCSLFISNDTGPLRFADALKKKIVALYGPLDEKVYGPYPFNEKRIIVVKKDLSCRPCYKRFKLPICNRNRECMNSISIKEVFEAARSLI